MKPTTVRLPGDLKTWLDSQSDSQSNIVRRLLEVEKAKQEGLVQPGDRVTAHGKDWMVLTVVAPMKSSSGSEIKAYLCTAVEWREVMAGSTAWNEGFGAPDAVQLIQVLKVSGEPA